MISIYLVDDHELVRTGIRRILEDERGIKVIGEAPDGETAVQWSRQNEADVILMDMNMPGMGGGWKPLVKFYVINPMQKLLC